MFQEELREAIRKNDIETVRKLVSAGVNVNAKDGDGATPLHLCYTNRHIEIIKILIEAGADINARYGEDGWALLQTAVRRRLVGVVDYLVKAGADLNTPDKEGHTPLYDAIRYIYEDYEESHGATRVSYALRRGDIARILVTGGADINTTNNDGETMIEQIVRGGRTDEIMRLTLAGVDINTIDSEGKALMHWAIHHNKSGVLEYLINNGADINIKDGKGKSPLYLATDMELEEVADKLISKGADVDEKNGHHSMTALHMAAKRGLVNIVKKLIAAGADVNIGNYCRETPLHHAADLGHARIAQELIAAGADINTGVSGGDRILDRAIKNRHRGVVVVLIEAGVNIRVGDLIGTDSDIAEILAMAMRAYPIIESKLIDAKASDYIQLVDLAQNLGGSKRLLSIVKKSLDGLEGSLKGLKIKREIFKKYPELAVNELGIDKLPMMSARTLFIQINNFFTEPKHGPKFKEELNKEDFKTRFEEIHALSGVKGEFEGQADEIINQAKAMEGYLKEAEKNVDDSFGKIGLTPAKYKNGLKNVEIMFRKNILSFTKVARTYQKLKEASAQSGASIETTQYAEEISRLIENNSQLLSATAELIFELLKMDSGKESTDLEEIRKLSEDVKLYTRRLDELE